MIARSLFLASTASVLAGCVAYAGQQQPAPAPQPSPTPAPQPVVVAQPMAPEATSTGVMQPQATSTGVMQPQPTVTVAPAPVQPWATSNFGTLTVAPGFTPDPRTVDGRSGGSQNARTLHTSCRGWVSTTPDHLLDATGSFSSLRILAQASEDVTLVVQRPDGSFACADDSEGRNPIVAGAFPAGRYAIWVGSYNQGVVAPYRLGVTELGHVTAASLGGGQGTAIQSNFGTIALATGFTPDPHIVEGRSGGGQAAQNVNGACRGWITQQPDHVFLATTAFRSLRVIAHSNEDVTLVIRAPSGAYLCNDDAEGRNPIVSGSFPAGAYQLWVGSYRQGVVAPYRLGFTELGSVTAASIGGGASGGGNENSNFGTVALATGFTPDPHVVNGRSGGATAASNVSAGCAGWISNRPDHLFQATTHFGNLRIIAASGQDTTLVVQRPNGTYLCNDDAEGRNPIVSGSFPAGTYRVWVGSYQQGTIAPYRLGFTELGHVSAASIGAP